MATFNGGFKIATAGGGFYLNGTSKGTLQRGAASMVYYRDGRVSIGTWGTDVHMTPQVRGVRQNLKLIVDHGNGMETYYAHLSRLSVLEGQEVRRGEQIGAVGSTGRVTAPHLHYEVRQGGAPVNPYHYLAKAGVVQLVKKDLPF